MKRMIKGKDAIFIDGGYPKLTSVAIVKVLNGDKLSYLDWHDLSERAWKMGARFKSGKWYIPKRNKPQRRKK